MPRNKIDNVVYNNSRKRITYAEQITKAMMGVHVSKASSVQH